MTETSNYRIVEAASMPRKTQGNYVVTAAEGIDRIAAFAIKSDAEEFVALLKKRKGAEWGAHTVAAVFLGFHRSSRPERGDQSLYAGLDAGER